jgi:hypothetical protein
LKAEFRLQQDGASQRPAILALDYFKTDLFRKKTFIVSYGVIKITRFIKKRRKRKEEVISL